MRLRATRARVTGVKSGGGGGGVPDPVDGDLIEFEVLSSSAIPNGGNINGNGTIARMRFKGLTASGTVDVSKLQLTVTRPGYNSSKVFSTSNCVDVIGTTGVYRQPDPNHASQLVNLVGADLDVYVSLSERVFVADQVSNIQVQSGFYGACTTSSLPSGTNSSTLAYPKPIPSWLFLQPWERVGPGGLAVEFMVDHWGARNGQTVAAVEPYITAGAESAVTISTMTASQKNQGPFAVPCFRGTIPITGLTNGLGTLNARIYPWVGNAVWDTAALGDAWPTASFSNAYPVCVDSSGIYAPAYAYVSHTGVQIGTPSVSTTHPGAYVPGTTPAYANVAAAGTAIRTFNAARGHDDLAGGAVIIPNQNMRAGLTASMASLTTYPVGLGLFTIESEPGATKIGTGFTSGGASKGFPRRTKFKNLEIRPGAVGTTHTVIDGSSAGAPTSQPTVGDAVYIVLDGCVGTGQNDNANPPVFRGGYRWMHNCTFSAMGDDLYVSSTANWAGLVACHGCDLDNSTNGTVSAPLQSVSVAGCHLKQVFAASQPAGANPTLKYQMRWGIRMSWQNLPGSANLSFGSRDLTDNGISLMNVLLVKTNDGSPNMQLYADSVVIPCDNLLASHISAAGGRCNMCYQDTGTTRIEKNIVVRYSALQEKNTKADRFPPASGNRTGTFPFRWGTDNFGVVSGDLSANSESYSSSSWLGEVRWPFGEDNVGDANMFVNDTGFWGDNSSPTGGDYSPLSVLLNRIPANRSVVPIDLLGNAVPHDGTGAAGALQ